MNATDWSAIRIHPGVVNLQFVPSLSQTYAADEKKKSVTISILPQLKEPQIRKFVKNKSRKILDRILFLVTENKTLPKLEKNERNKLLVEWISKSWAKIDANMITKSFNLCGYTCDDNNNNIEPIWTNYYKFK